MKPLLLTTTVCSLLIAGATYGTPSFADQAITKAASGTSETFDRTHPISNPVKLETQDVELRASLNKQVFQEGEEARITVQASQPVYLHLLSLAQDGTVTVLLPNRVAPRNRILGGQEFVFPNESLREMGIRMQVALPKGADRSVERIKVIATREKIELVKKGGTLDDVFHTYTSTEGGLQDVLKKLAGLEKKDWSETTLSYEVRK
ncbi:MAG: DUF4384 domain-containing protein [Nitrospirae bacterium]|nr:DUF4384 domain-containing protein [Nitrospirota bacterium]